MPNLITTTALAVSTQAILLLVVALGTYRAAPLFALALVVAAVFGVVGSVAYRRACSRLGVFLCQLGPVRPMRPNYWCALIVCNPAVLLAAAWNGPAELRIPLLIALLTVQTVLMARCGLATLVQFNPILRWGGLRVWEVTVPSSQERRTFALISSTPVESYDTIRVISAAPAVLWHG